MLSPHELEVMELLWSENRALTRTEIIELSPDKSWKPSTIHLLLNSLLKKEAIQVAGFTQTGKNYGRTFAAAITREEYTAQELCERLPKTGAARQVDLAGFFREMMNHAEIDQATLCKLQEILDEKRRALMEE